VITNKHNVPLSLAVWLAHQEYDASDDPKTISTTSLLKPIKSIVLGSRLTGDGSVDVSDMIASSMGTAIHTAIEHAWKSDALGSVLEALGYPQKVRNRLCINPKPEELTEASIPVYMEIRRTKEIEGWKVTGKFDFISNGRLEDFKSTSCMTYTTQSNKDKYIQQASIYRWLNQDLITDDTFVINYIFTDWSSAKAKQDKNYPQGRLLPQQYQLMSISDTERFIKDKLKKINTYMDKEEEEIPPCTPEELWLKPSIFKYYKNPQKMDRSTKNFDSYWEAHQKLVEDGSVGTVVEVKGEVVYCAFCSACVICKQAGQYINEGRLLIRS
jgi:hypothetical protein